MPSHRIRALDVIALTLLLNRPGTRAHIPGSSLSPWSVVICLGLFNNSSYYLAWQS
jgi:hypothetical protein